MRKLHVREANIVMSYELNLWSRHFDKVSVIYNKVIWLVSAMMVM